MWLSIDTLMLPSICKYLSREIEVCNIWFMCA